MKERSQLRHILFISFAAFLSNWMVSVNSTYAQMPDQWQQYIYQQSEFAKYIRALPGVRWEFNPYNTSSRVGKIYRQLAEYSGKQFALFPAQTGNIGQAHNGGIIIIDISKLSEPTEVLAFWLAHEWGHEDMGHAANIYQPYATQDWRYYFLPSLREDQADVYAAKFLAAKGYDRDPVLRNLRSLPPTAYNHSHSPGSIRATNVRRAYDNALGNLERQILKTLRVPCAHRIPCSHPAHPFDTVHPYDVDYYGHSFPCGHRIPCGHPLHSFDTMHQYDIETR